MTSSPAELRTLSRLLDQALALAPSARRAWLAGLYGSDAAYRDRLAQLLADADAPDDGFLTQPAIGRWRASEPMQPSEQPGTRVGPYLLERQIGSGGMGSVWLAQRADGVLDRSVALKLPHVAWGPALNARLARERDILARLAHPNIARLYDAGTDSRGRPFLALEYVEGVPIDEYLRQHPCGLEERLGLFKQVAGAVAYAHRHLVVHRDLKPSNVLVSSDGSAHLLDFGIAKLLDDDAEALTLLTRGPGRMLTPGYASPEQIRGEPVTVASDVYALGVLLYEILTGARPFNVTGASLTALEATVLQSPPPLASSRVTAKVTQRALRGDLDTILAKALRKEPEERYRTVDALIDDLDRHINGEPVLARPPSSWYRFSRFIGRHGDYVALASAALVAVLIGLGVAVVQANRARVEAQRARAQAERADEIRDFVIGLFDLNHGDDPNKLSMRQLPTDALVERGARRIQARYEGRPELRAEMMGIAGTIFADIGDPKRAIEMANGQLAALNASSGNDEQRVQALRTLARAQVQDMRNDLAEETLNQAIGEAESLPRRERAELRVALARVLLTRGKFAASTQQLDKAEALLTTDADRRSLVTSDALVTRATLQLWEQKDPVLARSTFDTAVKLAQELTGPLSPEVVAKRQFFAHNLVQFGQADSGRELLDGLLADLRRASGPEDLEAASLELSLIQRLNDNGSLPDFGIPRLEQISAAFERKGADVPPTLRAFADLVTGTAYWEHGEVERAAPLMRRALPELVEKPSPQAEDAPVFGIKYRAMYFYAQWADDRGEHEEATRLWDEIYRARYAALHANGVRRDAILDPQFYAIQSRIMAGDLVSARRRLAELKTQIIDGPAFVVSSRWEPRWEALALDILIRIESRQFAEASKLLQQWTGGVSEARRGELMIATFAPAGFAGLQGVIECNTGQPREGLTRLIAALNELKDRFSPDSPGIAALRSHTGLCALQAGEMQIARDMRDAARRAFGEQPGVSSFYKKPWTELEQRLAQRKLAAR
jgi:eukaryotic-like serine/threonine-protein kinase